MEQLEDRLLLSADPVLAWNEVMLAANAADHDPAAVPSPDQGGPTRTSRAFAMVSTAVFDALNSITHHAQPYLVELQGYESADPRAAVSAAAYHTLLHLYPQQQARFDAALAEWLAEIPNGPAEDQGVELGRLAAEACLNGRAADGWDAPVNIIRSTNRATTSPTPSIRIKAFWARSGGT